MDNDTLPPVAAGAEPGEERRIVLPAHGTTVTAEELKVRLVLAADLDERIEIHAGAVESLGQAVIQLLLAARAEAERSGKPFSILSPSPAFADCIAWCGLAETLQ